MKKRGLAAPALLGAVFIWGTTFVATKVALRDLGPLTLTLARFILALAALLPLAIRERRGARGPLPWRPLALAGLFGGALYFALQNVGMVYTSASQASLILACIPALTALGSGLLLHERIGGVRAVGVAASVLGVAIIVVGDRAASWQGGGLLGDLLIVLTAVAWAAYTVLGKSAEGRATPAVLSAATVGFGALFLLPFAGYEALTRPWPALTAGGLLSTAYLGVVASTLPFLFWNYALTRVDASEAAVYTNLVPLVAVATSVVWLREVIAPAQWLGGLLVLVGVWAAGRVRRPTDL